MKKIIFLLNKIKNSFNKIALSLNDDKRIVLIDSQKRMHTDQLKIQYVKKKKPNLTI